MMEPLPQFSILHPSTADEAARMRAENPDARFLAGGTDLMVNIRRGIERPSAVIDLGGIADLSSVSMAGNGDLRIGASVTLDRLIEDESIVSRFPVLVEAAKQVAGSTHRTMATVGGNLCLDTRCLFYNQSEWWRQSNDYCLKHRGEVCHVAPTGKRCHAAFSGDLAPALLVLGAEAEIVGPDGTRTIPLADLYRDDGADHLTLANGELLTAVTVPAASQSFVAGYEKNRVRGGIDFPLAGVAVALRRDGSSLAGLRVALTGTNSFPLLIDGADDLNGGTVDEALLDALQKLVMKQVQPMRSTLTASNYRRTVACALARRLTARLFAQA
ncbi:MAG: 4-hydroxybenzoyl-CoA reductase subunit beta [Rhodospirillales bacterium]|nr:4-hydroxybenzoyl-CoA reductase subunit beta [Rhodospirillales bacterium]